MDNKAHWEGDHRLWQWRTLVAPTLMKMNMI